MAGSERIEGVVNFRPPSTVNIHPANTETHKFHFQPPPVSFMQGIWYVTHSTLPMWKTNRNVTITYTSLENDIQVLDDLVEYQPLTSDKHKTVKGVDTPTADPAGGAYSWRGRGWLRIASSHWEVLGYGDQDGGWMVTYFNKTLFTPAGIDIYARRKGGLSEEMLEWIKDQLRAVKAEDPKFAGLADGIFAIHHNW
ncbi:hypothetical protein ABEF95_014775 [Exophiala dermatitidis]